LGRVNAECSVREERVGRARKRRGFYASMGKRGTNLILDPNKKLSSGGRVKRKSGRREDTSSEKGCGGTDSARVLETGQPAFKKAVCKVRNKNPSQKATSCAAKKKKIDLMQQRKREMDEEP